MAISSLVGAAQSYDRPSVFAMQANDNMVKESSDLLNLAISDFSSFLSKTNDSLQDLRDSSTKTIDGFRKVIRDLTNLDKNIRFKFTYLRKEIESSRNDFLTALRSISFDFAGGGYGEGGGDLPFTETTQTKVAASPPVFPPPLLGGNTRRSRGGGNTPRSPGGGKTPKTTTPKTTTPKTKTKTPGRTGSGGRTPGRTGSGGQTPGRTGSGGRTPGRTPKINIEIPGKPNARSFMAYEPPTKGKGVSGKNIGSLSGPGTGRFGLPQGYTASPASLPGTPQKTKFTKEQFNNEIRSSKAGKMAARGGGPALAVLEAVIGSLLAFNEWLKYKETGKKQHLKNAYAIGASTAGGLGGVAAGAAAGAFLGGPFAPLTGLVGGIIGGAKGAEQAEIVGRALYNVNNENMDFSDAFKLEALRYSYEKNQAELENKLNIITERLKLDEVEDIEQLPRAGRSAARNMMNDINKLSQEGGNKQNAIKSFERELQEKSKAPESNPSSTTTPRTSQSSTTTPRTSQSSTTTTGGAGRGGPAEPDLKGSGLEYQSRQTDPMNMMASYRNMEMDMNPEVYNMSDEVSEGDPNHPTGPMSVLPTADQMGGSTIHAFIYRQSQRDAFGRETNSIIA
jgi:hypothetical protein